MICMFRVAKRFSGTDMLLRSRKVDEPEVEGHLAECIMMFSAIIQAIPWMETASVYGFMVFLQP